MTLGAINGATPRGQNLIYDYVSIKELDFFFHVRSLKSLRFIFV